MKRVIIFGMLILILSGCAVENQIIKQEPIGKIEIPPLPNWVCQPPSNGVVGISIKSNDKEKMIDAAKQMATIIQSRNNSSFTIEKYASTTKEDNLSSNKSEFKLNVSSSPKRTQAIYKDLKKIGSTEIYGYYISLFSEKNIGKITSQSSIHNLPEYFDNNKLDISEKRIIYHSTACSSSLILAWEKAAEEARFEIAKYQQKNVQSAIINKNDNIDKRIAIETKKILRTRIISSFITTELKDNLRVYKVYHQMILKR